MRERIETVPSDGNFVILEDDSSGSYAVARWSVKANDWIGENGEPITIVPTHWHPLAGDKYRPQEDNEPDLLSPLGPAPSRRRRFGFFPFSASRAAPRRPAISNVVALKPTANAGRADAIETPTVPVKSKRTSRVRRRVVALSFATVVVAALLATSFHTDVVAHLKHYAGRQEVVRTGTPDVPVTSQTVQAAESATAALRQSLQQERDRTETLARDLATARRELARYTALAGKADDDAAQIKQAAESTTAELRQSLQQERNRAEALAQDLAIARREIETHTALANKASDDATQIKQAAESTATELRQSLQQERDRAEALAQDLATARREIDTRTALAGKANDDAAQIKRTAERAVAELRQSLQQERDRAEAQAKDLARARRDMEMFAALTGRADDDAAKIKQALESTTAEFRQSLQQERDKAEALTQDLATARREIDKHAALASKAADDAAQMKRAAESTTAELRQSLRQERDRAEALTRDLDSSRHLAAPRNALEPTTIALAQPVVQTAALQQPAAEDGPEVARLLARASALLNNGNIGAARIVLEHATATGSARASFALAETYDPLVLSTWGTYGTRGDPTLARELYAKAHAGGVKNAKERLNALQQ